MKEEADLCVSQQLKNVFIPFWLSNFWYVSHTFIQSYDFHVTLITCKDAVWNRKMLKYDKL